MSKRHEAKGVVLYVYLQFWDRRTEHLHIVVDEVPEVGDLIKLPYSERTDWWEVVSFTLDVAVLEPATDN